MYFYLCIFALYLCISALYWWSTLVPICQVVPSRWDRGSPAAANFINWQKLTFLFIAEKSQRGGGWGVIFDDLVCYRGLQNEMLCINLGLHIGREREAQNQNDQIGHIFGTKVWFTRTFWTHGLRPLPQVRLKFLGGSGGGRWQADSPQRINHLGHPIFLHDLLPGGFMGRGIGSGGARQKREGGGHPLYHLMAILWHSRILQEESSR